MHIDDCPTCELYHQNQKSINSFQYFDANSMLVSFITNQLFSIYLALVTSNQWETFRI